MDSYDLALFCPTEEDFRFIAEKKRKADKQKSNHITRSVNFSAPVNDTAKAVRYLIAAVLFGWKEMAEELKIICLSKNWTAMELQDILKEVAAHSPMFEADFKKVKQEYEDKKTKQLNIVISKNNSNTNFRRIIAYYNRPNYSAHAAQHLLVTKKDHATGKYNVVIGGTPWNYASHGYDEIPLFDSDQQAINFINNTNNIATVKDLTQFRFIVSSKPLPTGVDSLKDTVLVDTICGPCYMQKIARHCEENLQEKIVHLSNGDWQVQSEKGRNMGTYNTKKEAEKRLGQVEYFKHLNEEASKDLEDKIRSVIAHKETDDWHDGKAYLFEISDKSKNSNNGDIDPFWVEKFDDDEVDFSKLKVYDRTPEEKEDGKYIATFMISGGKNGSGEWTDYLNKLADAFKALKEKTGAEPLLYKLDTDICDDVWTGYVFLYDNDDNVKESLNEDLIIIEPFEAKEKIEEIKKQIEEAKDWKVRKNLLTLMNIYLFQTIYEADHQDETGCDINKAEWDEYSNWLTDEGKKLYDEHPELEKEEEEREAKIEVSVADSSSESEVEVEEKIEEDVEKHDKLNPKLFDNNHLKPKVREKCLEIVNLFLSMLEEDGIKIDIKDIIFTGSNASYNYTKDSDIDLHIIADTSNFECPDNLYPKLYDVYKRLFNSKYDITFYGIPVEIYVETGDTPLISNGIYSIKNDAWEQEPTETTIPEIDWNEFMKAYKPWEEEYFKIIDSTDPETATDYKQIDDFITKLYELRHQGLANEGQYGFSNLIFKELRNRGHLQKLKDLRSTVIANGLTLEALNKSANIDEKTRIIFRNKIGQISHNQPVIQNNGLFEIYNVKADDADYIIRELQRQNIVEYVDKSAEKYDFSKINFNGMPSRYYKLTGKIKI